MTDQKPLASQTAVVTGASSGIGRAIAIQLASAGAHVFLHGRTESALEDAKTSIESLSGKASIAMGDLRDIETGRGLVDRAVEATGRLDIMVNSAGLEYPASIIDGDADEWRTMLDTNVLALLVGCQAAVRAMRACEAEGHVVNISSVSAQRSNSGVYGATKHAMNVISASLRDELERDTIRVSNVMPGATATNFGRSFDPEFVNRIVMASGVDVDVKPGEHLSPEVLKQVQQNMSSLLADPDAVAKAVLYVVTQPIEVNIADIVVRPPMSIANLG